MGGPIYTSKVAFKLTERSCSKNSRTQSFAGMTFDLLHALTLPHATLAGPQGRRGEKGDMGTRSPVGEKGVTDLFGTRGEKGDQGIAGEPAGKCNVGPQGPK